MDPKEESRKPKIQKKEPDLEEHHESEEYESPTHSDPGSHQVEQEEDMAKMPKKNLQIEVIDHPEADAVAEHVENGEGSLEETDPNQYSEEVEPDYRRGTDNEEYQNNNGGQQESYKSFGEPQPHHYSEAEENEEK